MADYWRYSDMMAPGQIHEKRPRSDYDEVPLPGAASYGRGELRYDERDGRMPWRDPEPLDFGSDYNRSGVAYASGGMTGTDVSGLAGGHLMGMSVPGSVGYPSMGMSGLKDPSMMGQGGRLSGMDTSMMKGVNVDLNGGRYDYLPRQDIQGARAGGPGLLPTDAAPTLFIEGLPSDCSRREAAHVFRPFLGFKEVRLVHKESRRPEGDSFVLCFVEFTDPRCASVALEALQGSMQSFFMKEAIVTATEDSPSLGLELWPQIMKGRFSSCASYDLQRAAFYQYSPCLSCPGWFWRPFSKQFSCKNPDEDYNGAGMVGSISGNLEDSTDLFLEIFSLERQNTQQM